MSDVRAYHGRVVAAFDGSASSRVAATWAVAEAGARGVGLTLLHAVIPPVSSSGLGIGLPPSLDLIDELQAEATAQLQQLGRELSVDNLDTVVRIGAPSGVILEASESAELIVIGSRGRGGFTGLLLGSVGGQVAAHAECPVVVIRDRPLPTGRSIVVGVDGTTGSQSALAFAFDEASRHGYSLVAVHAWDVPAYDLLVVPNGPVPIPLTDVADSEIRLTAEVLSGFREDYPDVVVEERLIRAPAVQALVGAAADAAMMVVGTRGHSPAVGALLGSVSNGVLHKAQIPVCVVPVTPSEPRAA